MINDVTDKVRFEQEQIKNRKEKERTFLLQQNLDEVFGKHSAEVEELCLMLNKTSDTKLHDLVQSLKKSNAILYFNYCQFNDLINIKNDTFRKNLTKFEPRHLITSIVQETQNLFTYTPTLQFDKMGKALLGDSVRLQYILSSLIRNAVQRNSHF